MTAEERNLEAFQWWNRFRDECERLRYASQNLIIDLIHERTRRRYAALTIYDATEAEHRRIVSDMKGNDEELAAADTARNHARAEWHARHGHLWPPLRA